METVVLVIHLILALGIIGLVLLQRSEGGGLGIGGSGGGGLGGLATAKSTVNALTKLTALFAAGFFITSLTLGVLASMDNRSSTGILENVDEAAISTPATGESDGLEGITFTPPEEIIDLEIIPEAPTPTE